MTESTTPEPAAAAPSPVPQAAAPDVSGAPAATSAHDASDASDARQPSAATQAGKASGKRGNRNARGGRPAPAQRTVHPMLQTLYELYPRLFGARFLPLQLGVFEALVQAHPDRIRPEELKVALGLHTRSNRYLEAVASGLPRHDLQGRPLEPVAPEHVHHAILELYRRKSNTPQEPAARAKALEQLTAAIQSSGLGRDGYRERFGAGGSDAMRAMVEEALRAVGEKQARLEALMRAFRASGTSVHDFAEMYGLSREDAKALEAAVAAEAAPTASEPGSAS